MATRVPLAKPLRKFSRTLRKLRWNSARWFQNTITVQTPQGVFTVSSADQCIGKALFCSRQHELELITDATSLLQRLGRFPKNGKGTIVDLGANLGPISIGFLHLGLADQAIAVEPDPTNFSLLERNVAQNNLQDRMICLPYAVSDCATQVQFELCDWNPGDHRVRGAGAESRSPDSYDEQHREVIDVPCERLDKHSPRHLDVTPAKPKIAKSSFSVEMEVGETRGTVQIIDKVDAEFMQTGFHFVAAGCHGDKCWKITSASYWRNYLA